MTVRCFSESDAALYRGGYPHLIELVDGHGDDEKPDPTRIFAKKVTGLYHARWPRKVAQAFVRACTSQPSRAITAAADAAPITLDAARCALEHQLASPRSQAYYTDEALLFCIEALVGADAALDALVAILRALPAERWPVAGSPFDPAAHPRRDFIAPAIHRLNVLTPNGTVGYYAYLAGYLLLRASPAAASAARDALEELWRRTVDAEVPCVEETLRGGLDLALHGAEGARRVMPESHWQYLQWWGFVDDAAMLRARIAARSKSEWEPDPRLIWLVPELIDVLLQRKLVKKVEDRAAFLADVGKFDHPAVVQLMREQVDDKRAGAVAASWLAQHGHA